MNQNKISAIILAAGRGNRLSPITDDKPKCLLEIKGKTILERLLETLREYGINDISIVRGYKREMINFPGIKYYENINYKNNNILQSLFYAESEMNNAFIFSYSDIIYKKSVLKKLFESRSDISLIVDTDWKKQYENRKQHPVSEAELVKVKNDQIIKIGKNMTSKDSHGEFIGLAKFSEKGAEILKKEYHRVLKEIKNRQDQRFQNAICFEKAYLTDMIQELIDRGYSISNIDIQRNWMEIDTNEDLQKAELN